MLYRLSISEIEKSDSAKIKSAVVNLDEKNYQSFEFHRQPDKAGIVICKRLFK